MEQHLVGGQLRSGCCSWDYSMCCALRSQAAHAHAGSLPGRRVPGWTAAARHCCCGACGLGWRGAGSGCGQPPPGRPQWSQSSGSPPPRSGSSLHPPGGRPQSCSQKCVAVPPAAAVGQGSRPPLSNTACLQRCGQQQASRCPAVPAAAAGVCTQQPTLSGKHQHPTHLPVSM